jgi:nickel/cobalt transporter (NicO) family protein
MTKGITKAASLLAATVLCGATQASAQVSPRPFAVGGGEGGGGAEGGVTGWLLAEQSNLTHLMSAKVHALHADPAAVWGLVALGLAYGVFHAAGPGHGKALIASYMLANERSLRRGALLALLAALLQALVAIALVGAAALVFNATASTMNRAANWLEMASYAGVAAIGLWLAWKKGAALALAIRRHAERGRALAGSPAYAGAAWSSPALALPSTAFRASAPEAGLWIETECGHAHAPDPSTLAGPLSWRDAAGTVVAAGIRPCSGAILILVFALAQGLFAAGVAATFAMALGTAATTGALAFLAVFAKSTAMRLAGGEDSRSALIARGFEFAAALAVLTFGVALMFGARGAA